jgi:hypothetical protein
VLCHQLGFRDLIQRLEKGKGKKLSAKRSNSSLLGEAVYAMGALAGDPRLNPHYMELHNEDVARRAT